MKSERPVTDKEKKNSYNKISFRSFSFLSCPNTNHSHCFCQLFIVSKRPNKRTYFCLCCAQVLVCVLLSFVFFSLLLCIWLHIVFYRVTIMQCLWPNSATDTCLFVHTWVALQTATSKHDFYVLHFCLSISIRYTDNINLSFSICIYFPE